MLKTYEVTTFERNFFGQPKKYRVKAEDFNIQGSDATFYQKVPGYDEKETVAVFRSWDTIRLVEGAPV